MKSSLKFFLFLFVFSLFISHKGWAAKDPGKNFREVAKNFAKAQIAVQKKDIDTAGDYIRDNQELMDDLRKSARGRSRHLLKNNAASLKRLARDLYHNAGSKIRKTNRILAASFDANAALSQYFCLLDKSFPCSLNQCVTKENIYQVVLTDADKVYCK